MENLYINREISWLDFNDRVLDEAFDESLPLLERFKFLAITANNLDEFFIVRVAGLKDHLNLHYVNQDLSGLTALDQLTLIAKKAHLLEEKICQCNQLLLSELIKSGFKLVDYQELSTEEAQQITADFKNFYFPILTPMAIDKSRPFPFLSSKISHIIIRLKRSGKNLYAVVPIPSNLERLILIGENKFILLEEIILNNLDMLFPGYEVKATTMFRILRSADLAIDQVEGEDLLLAIEELLPQRRFGNPVKLEFLTNHDQKSLNFLTKMLKLSEEDIYYKQELIDKTIYFELYQKKIFPSQFYFQEKTPHRGMSLGNKNFFQYISKNDHLLIHPYQSFQTVVDFLDQAANDPQVIAIKQTLYRVGQDSPVIKALKLAASNGKQVTVQLELKARFDEESNIAFAKELDEAGCHVVYGLPGLKVHAKCTLVIRIENNHIKRYAHISTGNYNEATAEVYSDIGVFTAHQDICDDISMLFNYITGYSSYTNWKEIIVSPINSRSFFIKNIIREECIAKAGRKALIIAKMNSLVDKEIIENLYRAAENGVKIKLIVRGICCLNPEVNSNIEVISIVGRYLEHARLYYFHNDNQQQLYLSSADWMTRNLDRRVELTVPIYNSKIKNQLLNFLELNLKDNLKARVMQSPSNYQKRTPEEQVISLQEDLFEILTKES